MIKSVTMYSVVLEKWKKASLMLTLIRNILQKKRVVNI